MSYASQWSLHCRLAGAPRQLQHISMRSICHGSDYAPSLLIIHQTQANFHPLDIPSHTTPRQDATWRSVSSPSLRCCPSLSPL